MSVFSYESCHLFVLLLLFLKVVTFQVVLVSNGDRSFILINYGDIAQTARVWLVSEDRYTFCK